MIKDVIDHPRRAAFSPGLCFRSPKAIAQATLSIATLSQNADKICCSQIFILNKLCGS